MTTLDTNNSCGPQGCSPRDLQILPLEKLEQPQEDYGVILDAKCRMMAMPRLTSPMADTHAHLAMLKNPGVALARAALYGIRFITTVTDVMEDPAATYDSLELWRQQARDIIATWKREAAQFMANPSAGHPWITEDLALRIALLTPDHAVPHIRVAIACHPHEASKWNQEREADLRHFAADPRTCVIGEIGLDYHYDFSPRDAQCQVFREQICLAKEFQLPIMLHVREAHDEAYEILVDEGLPEAGTLLHCFSENPATMNKFLDLGCLVAFGGAMTFNNAAVARQSAATCPPDRLVVETDAPYMAPVPLRGTDCEPAHVAVTMARLMEERNVAWAPCVVRRQFLETVYQNSLQFFNRPPSPWQEAQRAQQQNTCGQQARQQELCGQQARQQEVQS